MVTWVRRSLMAATGVVNGHTDCGQSQHKISDEVIKVRSDWRIILNTDHHYLPWTDFCFWAEIEQSVHRFIHHPLFSPSHGNSMPCHLRQLLMKEGINLTWSDVIKVAELDIYRFRYTLTKPSLWYPSDWNNPPSSSWYALLDLRTLKKCVN